MILRGDQVFDIQHQSHLHAIVGITPYLCFAWRNRLILVQKRSSQTNTIGANFDGEELASEMKT